MKNTFSPAQLLAAFALAAMTSFHVTAVTAPATATVQQATSSYKRVYIDAPALQSNKISEPALRDIYVYLPKQYFTSDAPLPVIYFLPGFGVNSIVGVKVRADFDQVFTKLPPAIVVIVPGNTRFGGGFYVDSAVAGNWSQFVVKDVVNYIDANYRTLAKRQSRGIAGHSMGGFGALDLAMRHSNVFGSVFAMAPGLVGKKGILDTQMFESEAHIKQFIASIETIKNLPATELVKNLLNHPNNFDIAYGMAFSAIDSPPFFEYPFTIEGEKLVRNDAILAKWEAGFGAVPNEVTRFKTQLKSLNGIGLDCARNDEFQWITRGCDDYYKELKAAGIDLEYSLHDGFHMQNLRERTLEVMLPFLSQRLATQ